MNLCSFTVIDQLNNITDLDPKESFVTNAVIAGTVACIIIILCVSTVIIKLRKRNQPQVLTLFVPQIIKLSVYVRPA